MEYSNVGSKFESSFNKMKYKLFIDYLEPLFIFQVLRNTPYFTVDSQMHGIK